ncbi:hypothetical protein MED222_05050 [Vibrio sp. MED222]|nr:hypothetical protein MED222_05050 [Vibrio sp. MED222]
MLQQEPKALQSRLMIQTLRLKVVSGTGSRLIFQQQ